MMILNQKDGTVRVADPSGKTFVLSMDGAAQDADLVLVNASGERVGTCRLNREAAPKSAPTFDANGLARKMIERATGVEGPCGCGEFAKYLEQLGPDGIAADPGTVAHRLVLEARRRVDELDKQADTAMERAEKSREALAELDEARALGIVTAVL